MPAVPPLIEYRSFDNLDGISVVLTEYQRAYLISIWERGYTDRIQLRGEVGASELGMHMQIVSRIGIVAFCRPDYPGYAYVVLDNGQIVDGAFHRFEDGRFSLS